MNAITHFYNFNYNETSIFVYHANIGQGIPKHEHIYAHATMCNAGSCLVTVQSKDGEIKEYKINKFDRPLELGFGRWHEIEALEDGTVFVNVFAEGKY